MFPEKKGGSHKMARPQQNWGLLTRWASIWTMPNTASPKSEPPCGRAVYNPPTHTPPPPPPPPPTPTPPPPTPPPTPPHPPTHPPPPPHPPCERGGAYIRGFTVCQQTGSVLVQVMAYHLLGAKPLPVWSNVDLLSTGLQEQTSSKCDLKYENTSIVESAFENVFSKIIRMYFLNWSTRLFKFLPKFSVLKHPGKLQQK